MEVTQQFYFGSFRPAELLTSDVEGREGLVVPVFGCLGWSGRHLRETQPCARQPWQSMSLRNGILLEGNRRETAASRAGWWGNEREKSGGREEEANTPPTAPLRGSRGDGRSVPGTDLCLVPQKWARGQMGRGTGWRPAFSDSLPESVLRLSFCENSREAHGPA